MGKMPGKMYVCDIAFIPSLYTQLQFVRVAPLVIYIQARIQVLSYKLRYIVGFCLIEMAISTNGNQKPTIYRNLYKNATPGP